MLESWSMKKNLLVIIVCLLKFSNLCADDTLIGKWVNEKSKLKGKTKFGLRRKIVEKAWIKLRNLTKLDINILRVSGIYSKENNVLKKIINNNIYVKEKKYFSRIRIEDLALIIKKTFYSKKKLSFNKKL